MITQISLSNTTYFKLFIGKRVLKEDIYKSNGRIPIYSANVFKPLGYSDTTTITDSQHTYLLWGIDGKFEFNIKHKGEKFETTDHCGAIEILDEDIVSEYLLYQLRIKSHILGFDRSLRSSLKNMRDVEVEIPIEPNGKFSVNEQKKLANKYNLLEKTKEKISNLNRDITETFVDVQLNGQTKVFEVRDIFDFAETNSGITKEFCINNKGNIPVYASAKAENSVLGYIKDNLQGVKYYSNSLTWNRNGAVGYFFLRNGKFSTNEDHRVLLTREKYSGRIDLVCMRYILETRIKELGYGFTNKLGSGKLGKVEITLPVGVDGEPSLNKQLELRQIYEKIDKIKLRLVENLQGLEAVNVELSS